MRDHKSEIEAVKQLGEQMGYGHMMSVASALWRKSLKEIDIPESGAFVPTISHLIRDEDQVMTKQGMDFYDKYVEKKQF